LDDLTPEQKWATRFLQRINDPFSENIRPNPGNWDRWLLSRPDSENIDDRRTPYESPENVSGRRFKEAAKKKRDVEEEADRIKLEGLSRDPAAMANAQREIAEEVARLKSRPPPTIDRTTEMRDAAEANRIRANQEGARQPWQGLLPSWLRQQY
jgi:hypothetical protein